MGTPDAANGSSAAVSVGSAPERLGGSQLGGERLAALGRGLERGRDQHQPHGAIAARDGLLAALDGGDAAGERIDLAALDRGAGGKLLRQRGERRGGGVGAGARLARGGENVVAAAAERGDGFGQRLDLAVDGGDAIGQARIARRRPRGHDRGFERVDPAHHFFQGAAIDAGRGRTAARGRALRARGRRAGQSTALTPLSRLVSRPMVPSTARTMPAPATPAPSMDTPGGSQPRRRGGRSADESDGGVADEERGGGIVIRGGIGRCRGRGRAVVSRFRRRALPRIRGGADRLGATSSAVGSEVRGRSRAGGGSPEAGGWSWSLVTRPVLCRFAPGMKNSLVVA